MALIDFDDARRRLAARANSLDVTTETLADARGHRLAEAIRADVDQPPGDVSAMDGYALSAADLGSHSLEVEFEVQAGDPPRALSPGRAARIFTGALVPEGADTVVPQEKATRDGSRVALDALPTGSHVRRKGEIFAAGDTVLDVGTRLTPGLLAIAAAAGAANVRVVRRPRIAFVSTGSELVPTHSIPGPGQIRDSNGPLVSALAAEAHLPVTRLDHAIDEIAPLTDTLAAARGVSDIIVTAGGVSVGDYDLVPEAVSRLGGETIFHGVRVRPGKPIYVARFDDAWFVGLPGNPVAVAVGWRVFVRPLAERLAGDRNAFDERPLGAVLNDDVQNKSPRLLLRPVTIRSSGDGLVADVGAWKGSHDIVGAGSANGLLAIPEESSSPPGSTLPFYPLPWTTIHHEDDSNR